MRGLNITVLLLVSCSTRLKKAKTLNLAAAMCYVVVIEEKAKAFGCLFIHYCQFLALQLSSGENTIGNFGNGKLQLVHVVSVLKRNIAQKKRQLVFALNLGRRQQRGRGRGRPGVDSWRTPPTSC